MFSPDSFRSRTPDPLSQLEAAQIENAYNFRVNLSGLLVAAVVTAGFYYGSLAAREDVEEQQQGLEDIAKSHTREYTAACAAMIKSENPTLIVLEDDQSVRDCAYGMALEATQKKFKDPILDTYSFFPEIGKAFSAAVGLVALYNLVRVLQRVVTGSQLKKKINDLAPPGP